MKESPVMAYVPPHLRQKRSDGASTSEHAKGFAAQDARKDDNNRSLKEISEHFWPTDPTTGETPKDSQRNGTLHDSAATPNQLAYIILFHDANPRWVSDGIIFTKTELEILPSELATKLGSTRTSAVQRRASNTAAQSPPPQLESPNKARSPASYVEEQDASIQPHEPIAVFAQTSSNRNGRAFHFTGWYKVTKLTFLEPHTAALARMLEQKWSRTDRFGNARPVKRDVVKWNESLGYRWAVVSLDKDVEAQKRKGKLEIAKLPEEDAVDTKPKKSVNELLAEMRMGG